MVPDLVLRMRAATIAQDAPRLAALYAEDGVHEFPFTTPGGPTRFAGRAAFEEFAATMFRLLPLRYTDYRTVAVHGTGSTIIVEQEAVGVHTATGASFVLPNVMVIEVAPDGLIARVRDYANPAAVAAVLGSD